MTSNHQQIGAARRGASTCSLNWTRARAQAESALVHGHGRMKAFVTVTG